MEVENYHSQLALHEPKCLLPWLERERERERECMCIIHNFCMRVTVCIWIYLFRYIYVISIHIYCQAWSQVHPISKGASGLCTSSFSGSIWVWIQNLSSSPLTYIVFHFKSAHPVKFPHIFPLKTCSYFPTHRIFSGIHLFWNPQNNAISCNGNPTWIHLAICWKAECLRCNAANRKQGEENPEDDVEITSVETEKEVT